MWNERMQTNNLEQTMTTKIPQQLAEQLVQLAPDKQAEMLAQWIWQTVVLEHDRKSLLISVVISGLSGILGGVIGGVAPLLTQHWLK